MNAILRDIDITDVIDSIDPTEVEGDHVEVPANHEPTFELDDPSFDLERGVWIRELDVTWKLEGQGDVGLQSHGCTLRGSLSRCVDGTEEPYPWDLVLSLLA